ncbi:MAG: hypothetical protein IJ723_08145, partial [Ruminococcus sp.]|nr:hypothetical protein [Ruminococcus sp.]
MKTTERTNINEMWEQLFGELWRTVAAAGIQAGAFLLDDVERSVLCDGTARELLGLPADSDDGVDYDRLRGVLDRLIELRGDDLPLTLSCMG